MSNFLNKWWLHICIAILLLIPTSLIINDVVVKNNVQLIQEWNDNQFTFDYDDEKDVYDCFTNKHIYVTPDNVSIRYVPYSSFSDFVLQLWKEADYSGIFAKNIEVYKLVLYLKL